MTSTEKKKYPHCADALTYVEGVLAGTIPACKWIKLACQRQVNDLKRASEGWEYRFDFEAGERVCRFIELLPHVKGKWAQKNEKIKLEPWQKFNLTTIFGWVKVSDGFRRFREVYDEIPRKNGKSLLAAGIGLYMFAAEKEFGAEVYSGATSEKQAWEVFRPAKQMAQRTPDLQEHFGIEIHAKSLSRLEDESRFEPVIGKPGDGASPSCAIVDEYHEHDTDELFETMMTGMDAREQPLAFVITTAGSNLAGPCYAKRDYLQKVLTGIIKDDRLFGTIYTVDDTDDWTDPEVLRKANPNFGVSIFEDNILAALTTAMQSARLQNGFKTKRLNIWCGAKNVWLNMQTWAKAPAVKPLDELRGRRCFVGLDLASKLDIAALVQLFPPDKEDPLWHVHCRFYLPEDYVEEGGANASHYQTWAKLGYLTLTPGNVIDYEYIEDDLKELGSVYQVEEIPYDPWQATQLATRMMAEGLPMVEVGATVKNFSEPMKELESLIKKEHLAHGDNPVLNWMASNVTAKEDKKENIYPNKDLPENKIDGMVALIMAVGRAIVHQGGGKSFWEQQ